MSTRCYDVEDCKEYGPIAAVILYNLRFWIKKNKANQKHCHEGRYWTYNSVKAFDELFPEFTRKQIRRALDTLVDAGVLLRGNFNKSAYDRTSWFAVNETWNCPDGPIHLPDKANGSAAEGEPIPDINADIIPDITTDNPPIVPPCDEAVELWNEMARETGLSVVQKMIPKRRKALHKRLEDAGGIEGWKHALDLIRQSDFLKGENNRGWRATFDFILREDKFTLLMEGAYNRNNGESTADIFKRYYAEMEGSNEQV